MEYFAQLKKYLHALCVGHGLYDQPVAIIARTLTAKEAIGDPEKEDFPLLKGKEVMIEASFQKGRGEGYTTMPGQFKGTVRDLLDLPLVNDLERACFIAGLNAVMQHLGLVEKTVHCRNREPEICAAQLVEFVEQRFGASRIAFFGFQPAMIHALSKKFAIRVVDLDQDNIGKTKYGVTIDGPEATKDNIAWADLVLATGSTAVNATISRFFGDKPTVFYGVTIAGPASILGCKRFCPCAS